MEFGAQAYMHTHRVSLGIDLIIRHIFEIAFFGQFRGDPFLADAHGCGICAVMGFAVQLFEETIGHIHVEPYDIVDAMLIPLGRLLLGATLAQLYVIEVGLDITEILRGPVLRLDPGSIGIHVGVERRIVKGRIADFMLIVLPPDTIGQPHGLVGVPARTVGEILQGKRSVRPLPDGRRCGNLVGILCKEGEGQAQEQSTEQDTFHRFRNKNEGRRKRRRSGGTRLGL